MKNEKICIYYKFKNTGLNVSNTSAV